MLRRIIGKAIFVCMLSGCLSISVSAAVIDNPVDSPMASNYTAAAAALNISDSGTASISGRVMGKAGRTTKISMHMYLQKYSDGKWTSIADWSGSKEASSYSLKKTKAVSKGVKYRTKAVCRVYAGSDVESVTKYSSVVKY